MQNTDGTRTLTLELPADLVARLSHLRPEELNAFAVAAIADAAEEQEQSAQELRRETAGLGELRPYAEYPDRAAYLADARAKAQENGGDPDLVEALASGLADAEEGKSVSLEEWSAGMDAFLAERLASARARETDAAR